jgi:hypothetical protein
MATDRASMTKPKETRSQISDSATPTNGVVVMAGTIPDGSPIDLSTRQRCIVLAALKDSIAVSNAAQYEIAMGHVATIREQIDAIDTAYQPAIDKLRVPLDAFYEDKRMLLKPLKDADKILSDVALGWKVAEDERAELEQRRLQAEADEQARKDRAAQEAAIEAERKRALKAGNKDKAAELEAEAETLAEQPVIGRQVQVSSSAPLVEGMAAGDKWKIREDTIDIKKLCEAVLRGWCSVEAVLPNVKYLNGRAKLEKKRFNAVDDKTKRTMFPGVQAYNAGSARRT